MEALKLYLREIKDIPLLTPEEEISLAFEISNLAAPMRQKLEKSKIVNYLIDMQNLINSRN